MDCAIFFPFYIGSHEHPLLTHAGEGAPVADREALLAAFSPYDLKRLHTYARSLVDYHVIVDLLPACVARRYGLLVCVVCDALCVMYCVCARY